MDIYQRMYSNENKSSVASRQIFPQQSAPPSPYMKSSTVSTGASTPSVLPDDELVAARNVLRSVIASSSKSPLIPSRPIPADTPPVPAFGPAVSQRSAVGLDRLVRAAGLSIANFATELKTLERRMESQHHELLEAINELKRKR